ncbi:Hypothetical predicted protein [Cloeon dipterum]|uniref:NADH:ubiquinone oxidoreductase intermediate-associated protein 30 domain-containing protein n=2 Tax=Cloeon dipterum TaxID=197152 RepID=A0A8S1CJ36_9INSE|nr:Hypothetical predicted protein [Cloeon dipterum]
MAETLKLCQVLLRRRLLKLGYSSSRQSFHTSARNQIYDKDSKGGFRKEGDLNFPSRTEMIRDGFKQLKGEIMLWKEEVKEKLAMDPLMVARKGEVDVQWHFNNPEELAKFQLNSDKDHNHGYSTCEFKMSPSGKGLFTGFIDTRVPKDGIINTAGYCSMRTYRARKSFKRDSYLNWSMYNTLVMRVRGDGRSYQLNIANAGYFDQMWNDVFNFVLYTRGGPYWQLSKIPFSKFFYVSKGRVQDKQRPINLEMVSHFGITATDNSSGEFNLEIDYIGLEFDPAHQETFAYEMYKHDNFIVGH